MTWKRVPGVGRVLAGLGIALPRGRALTKEHVAWAYRLFLDREPESEQAVRDKLRAWTTTQDLRRDFLISPEFRERNPSSAGYLIAPTVVLAELPDGSRLFVDLSDVAIGLNVARGLYEPSETAFVKSAVRPGQSVIDVGANIGYYSVLMASLVGSTGHVAAYEPLEGNARLLERSVAENELEKVVSLRRAALGASRSSTELVYLPLETGALNSGGAYLATAGGTLPPHHRAQAVSVEPLDEQELPRPVSFIKIDVEGAEPLVFRGGRSLLTTDRPTILSEINPTQLKTVSGTGGAELIAEMRELGYRCRILVDGAPGAEVTQLDSDSVRSVVFQPR